MSARPRSLPARLRGAAVGLDRGSGCGRRHRRAARDASRPDHLGRADPGSWRRRVAPVGAARAEPQALAVRQRPQAVRHLRLLRDPPNRRLRRGNVRAGSGPRPAAVPRIPRFIPTGRTTSPRWRTTCAPRKETCRDLRFRYSPTRQAFAGVPTTRAAASASAPMPRTDQGVWRCEASSAESPHRRPRAPRRLRPKSPQHAEPVLAPARWRPTCCVTGPGGAVRKLLATRNFDAQIEHEPRSRCTVLIANTATLHGFR